MPYDNPFLQLLMTAITDLDGLDGESDDDTENEEVEEGGGDGAMGGGGDPNTNNGQLHPQQSLARIIQLINPQTGGRKFPSRGINLVDVRTPEMQAMEQAFMGLFGGMAQNPLQQFTQMFGAPEMPGIAPVSNQFGYSPNNLLGMLFGGAGQGGGGSGPRDNPGGWIPPETTDPGDGSIWDIPFNTRSRD